MILNHDSLEKSADWVDDNLLPFVAAMNSSLSKVRLVAIAHDHIQTVIIARIVDEANDGVVKAWVRRVLEVRNLDLRIITVGTVLELKHLLLDQQLVACHLESGLLDRFDHKRFCVAHNLEVLLDFEIPGLGDLLQQLISVLAKIIPNNLSHVPETLAHLFDLGSLVLQLGPFRLKLGNGGIMVTLQASGLTEDPLTHLHGLFALFIEVLGLELYVWLAVHSLPVDILAELLLPGGDIIGGHAFLERL